MALFGKKAADAVELEEYSEEVSEEVGPKDSHGGLCPDGYLDLGSLYVPALPGIQLRAQFEDDKKTLRRILLVTGTSAIQLSVIAAPRSGGVWAELREQIAASIAQTNGACESVDTIYGTELAARIPARLPDGSEGLQPLRIIGIEGPRWLLRVDLQGLAAADDATARTQCEEVIDRIIVNRGAEPRVRMEMLPLTLPSPSKK